MVSKESSFIGELKVKMDTTSLTTTMKKPKPGYKLMIIKYQLETTIKEKTNKP